MGILPELEKLLPSIPKFIRNRLRSEKQGIEELLKRYVWYTVSEDVDIACNCAAADSSFMVIESRVGYIFVVQGVAVLYGLENGRAKQIAAEVFSDLGMITATPLKKTHIIRKSLLKRALTEYAYLLELENLLKLVKRCDNVLALVDGSFMSFAATTPTRDFDIHIESVKGVQGLSEVEQKKFKCIQALAEHRHTVFVSKSSNAGFYTQGFYPDMYVLDIARLMGIEPYNASGFLEPLVLDVKSTLARLIKGRIGVEKFTVTYVRLRMGMPVYQVSLPYEIDVDGMKSVYLCLKKWSASGYPMPLEFAHRLSAIPRKQLVKAMVALGVPIATGREIIEI